MERKILNVTSDAINSLRNGEPHEAARLLFILAQDVKKHANSFPKKFRPKTELQKLIYDSLPSTFEDLWQKHGKVDSTGKKNAGGVGSVLTMLELHGFAERVNGVWVKTEI